MGGSLPLYITPYVSTGDDFGAGGEFNGPPAAPSLLTSSWEAVHGWITGNHNASTNPDQSLMQDSKAMRAAGLITSVMGGVSSAIGSFYAAKSAQYEEKSQASSLAYQSDMAAISASRAEITAESIRQAGNDRISSYTMAAGEQKAGATASMAARGVALGVGSAADVSASMDLQKDMTVHNINANTVRQEWAARQAGTNYANQSLLMRTGAANANSSANSISPGAAMFSSLLGSATRVAGQWDYSQWMRSRLEQGGGVPQIGIG